MSQADRVRSQDARAMRAFLRAGLADLATYSDTSNYAEDVRVMIDRDVQLIGEYGQVSGQKTSCSFLRADVPAPKQRATVTVGGERWTLESKIFEDESISQWVLNRGQF